MAITKENLITIISEALDSDTAITDESSMDNISEWDSLGHLSILTSLDQATGGKASSISDLGETQSVKEIISILQNENLIDES